MRWTIAQVAGALVARAGAGLDPVARLAGVSIDSRTIRAGELFIAIHGASHDGHDHVAGAFERTCHMIVSIVTRSVDGDKQFAGSNGARINRDAGQPGHGVKPRSRPRHQNASHLCNRPPHKYLRGFALRPSPMVCLVLTGSLGSSLISLSLAGSIKTGALTGTRARTVLPSLRARCQTSCRFSAAWCPANQT